MEQYIPVSLLNDFVYSPSSIYLHSIYQEFDQSIYKSRFQTNGTLNHTTIDNGKYSTSANTLQGTIKDIQLASDFNSLLGIEGNMAKLYFGTLFQSHNWNGRTPRAKTDITNLLLDIGYTYLFNFVDSLLKLYGFDTYSRALLYSVFEIKNSSRLLNIILNEIDKVYKPKFTMADSILIIPISIADQKKIVRYGYGAEEEKEILWIK